MNTEQLRILKSFYAPFVFVTILWLVKLIEIDFNLDFSSYGLLPRHVVGLRGIVTMPFIHSDIKHLFSNSIPLIILGASLIYFYKESATKVFLLVYFLDGIWLWMGGRESYHIGASGIVYGLATFLFFSGIFRKYIRLMAISMLVVFLYGGMVWGIFPLFIGISWEAHLFGAFAGLLCAWIFRKEGPQRPVYEWEDESDDEDEWQQQNESVSINYHYRSKSEFNEIISQLNMLKIEHIGIAVKNMQQSNELFRKLFNAPHYKTETVESEHVLTSFFKVGENKIELLEALNENSAIAKYIEKRGEGVHHIAFAVSDIYKEMDRLEQEGFVLLNREPKIGADNKLVCFLHPKGTNGVLIELCQERE